MDVSRETSDSAIRGRYIEFGRSSACPEVLLASKSSSPQIIDYEGSGYRTDFWEGQGREYEDLAERYAIQRLLPPTGRVIVEAGAGFGRLANLYDGYERIILTDYSLSLLREARERWGHDPRFLFVAANIYNLPFVDDLLDALVMIRVMHHLESPEIALAEISRVLNGGKTFVLEYANKRNLKSIIRFWMKRQSWDPFQPQPYEFVPLNFDFHPAWMTEQLDKVGFTVEAELAVSNFRVGAIKRHVSPIWLARADRALSGPGAALKLSPSVMLRCSNSGICSALSGMIFRCPECGQADLLEERAALLCRSCAATWPIRNGIYDLRFPRVEDV